jgi:hypothetical protein
MNNAFDYALKYYISPHNKNADEVLLKRESILLRRVEFC